MTHDVNSAAIEVVLLHKVHLTAWQLRESLLARAEILEKFGRSEKPRYSSTARRL